MSTITQGQRVSLQAAVAAAALAANLPQALLAPEDGFLAELSVVVTEAISTGGTIKVQNSASADVGGLSVTIPNGAAVGTIFKSVATRGDLNRPCARDSLVRLVPAAFTGGGAVRAHITIRTADNPQMPY